jgi:general stress protein 26
MDKPNDDRARLHTLTREFRDGMLVTRSSDGTIHARPMSVAKLDANDDIFFATSIDSGKIEDVEQGNQVAVTFQSPRAYVSLSGTARIVKDKTTIDSVWSEPMRVWFPKGKEDPSLCVLRFHPVAGEFWNMEGGKGLKYLFDAAKAYVTGTTPPADPEQHGVVHRS